MVFRRPSVSVEVIFRKVSSSKRPEVAEHNQEIETLVDGMTPEEIELNFRDAQNENQPQNNSNDNEDLLRDVQNDNEDHLENEVENDKEELTVTQRQVKKGKIETLTRSKTFCL